MIRCCSIGLFGVWTTPGDFSSELAESQNRLVSKMLVLFLQPAHKQRGSKVSDLRPKAQLIHSSIQDIFAL